MSELNQYYRQKVKRDVELYRDQIDLINSMDKLQKITFDECLRKIIDQFIDDYVENEDEDEGFDEAQEKWYQYLKSLHKKDPTK